jgi:subtilisin family serine protease
MRSRAVLGLVAAPLVCAAAAASTGVPPGLAASARAHGAVRVIVRLAPAPTRAALRQRQDRVLARTRARERGEARRFANFELLALPASAPELGALAASADVIGLEEDRLLAPSLDSSAPLVGATETTRAGLDGAGFAVAILDSGVDTAHPFFAGRVAAEACFSARANCPNGRASQIGPGAGAPCDFAAICSHGTHVAGIAVGADARFPGVAPGARLIAVQIFSRFQGADCASAGIDPCALAWTSDLLAGLDYVRTLSASMPIAAVNLSFGSGRFASKKSCQRAVRSTKHAVDRLLARNIAVVAASGNDGFANALNQPACIAAAISVGATTDGDAVWESSNAAAGLDLLAPGVSVRSASPGGGTSYRTGTSQAAAQVSGALAVLRQRRPAASVAELLAALRESGVPVADPRNGLVRPRIRVDLAAGAL